MTGVMAMLLICGAALLNGAATVGPKTTNGNSRGNLRAEVPPFTTVAYPKDFKRNTDPRWRHPIAGDDFYDLDPPEAHLSHATLSVISAVLDQPSFPRSAFSTFTHFHRPQAARAPPQV